MGNKVKEETGTAILSYSSEKCQNENEGGLCQVDAYVQVGLKKVIFLSILGKFELLITIGCTNYRKGGFFVLMVLFQG